MNLFIYIIIYFSNALAHRRDKSLLFIFALFALSYLIIDGDTQIIEHLNPQNTLLCFSLPVISYPNAETYKSVILNDNKGKARIYKWTYISSEKIYIASAINISKRLKIYIGSAINISKRLKNYFNLSYLEREIKTNNTMIYRGI